MSEFFTPSDRLDLGGMCVRPSRTHPSFEPAAGKSFSAAQMVGVADWSLTRDSSSSARARPSVVSSSPVLSFERKQFPCVRASYIHLMFLHSPLPLRLPRDLVLAGFTLCAVADRLRILCHNGTALS